MQPDYNLIKLTPAQIEHIYRRLLKLDFPLMERKPYRAVRDLVERGLYIGYALADGERIAAYALLCRAEQGQALLLDYLAVPSGQDKGHGLGTRLVAELGASLDAGQFLVGEIESITKAKTEQQQEERQRRWGFYQRNGWRMTGVENRLLGVDYNIITLNCDLPDGEVWTALNNVYKVMFGPWVSRVILRMPPLQ